MDKKKKPSQKRKRVSGQLKNLVRKLGVKPLVTLIDPVDTDIKETMDDFDKLNPRKEE